MAYCLEHGEAAGTGLKRIVTEEIDAALARIATSTEADRDEAIHESRKSVKKIRAVLRLVRERAPRLCNREMRRLRTIARELSDLRDAAAMIEAFDTLMNGKHRLRAVRAGLVESRDSAVNHRKTDQVLDRTFAAFQKMKRRVGEWKLHVAKIDGLGPAIEKSRKKARRLWKLSRKHPDPALWHEFRKKVKDHVYHARLLGAAPGGANAGRKKKLEDLEEALGEDHNLVVLNDIVTANPNRFGGEKTVAQTMELLGVRQRKLRTLSLQLGSKLYQDKDGANPI